MTPIPMILHCPKCVEQHIDEGDWETRPHRTHLCAKCAHEWKPSFYPTVGVVSMSAETLPTQERIDRAMANTAVDDIITGKPADPYTRFAAIGEQSATQSSKEPRKVHWTMSPALGAPYEPPSAAEIAEARAIKGKVLQQITDAQRWQALMNAPRLRFIGSGKLGEKHAHLCMEIWGEYPNLNSEDRADVIVARRILLQFVDGIRK